MWNVMWHHLPDPASLAMALSQAMQRDAMLALRSQDSVLIGLAGGSTPMAAYADFASAKLPWQQLQFVLIDERFVPITDPQSNEGNISQAFAAIKPLARAWQGLYQEAESIEQSANLADAQVKNLGGAMDVVVIGMGSDGHIASLFVESADYISAMDVDNPRAVTSIRFSQAEQKIDRLSFTLPEILKAKKALICITGDDKRQVIEQSLSASRPEYAIARFFKAYQHPIEIFWSPA